MAERLVTEDLVILLIEDNIDHAELVMENMKICPFPTKIFHVKDGEEAMNFLYRQKEYSDPQKSPRPHVIILDLRIPKIDGMELLEKIKSSDDLKSIPVVILTTSSEEKDVLQAYNHHVNSYLVKPLDSAKFTRMIKDLQFYWLKWNIPPTSKKS